MGAPLVGDQRRWAILRAQQLRADLLRLEGERDGLRRALAFRRPTGDGFHRETTRRLQERLAHTHRDHVATRVALDNAESELAL